jgi:pimeloyl-ACP methyl ester carboxylesterase
MIVAPFVYRAFGVLSIVAGLSSCATPPADISRVEAPVKVNQGASATSETRALHDLLTTALAGGPEGDHALAHFVELWHQRRPGQTTSLLGDKAVGTAYQVSFASESAGCYAIDYFDTLSPAVDYEVRKLAPRYKRTGVGATLLGVRENRGAAPIERYYPPEAITRAVSAWAEAGPAVAGIRSVKISLLCPIRHDSVTVGGEARPLAADWTVPWAALLARTGKLKATALPGLIRRKAPRPATIYLTEPYDPQKTPLIMIHGLLSTPLVWAKLSNHLRGDDAVRERYQIWHFLYPTSPPALYSARVFRTQLDELRAFLDPEGDDPAMRNTVLIGHSMGGLISKTTIVRPRDAYWDVAFDRPFKALNLSPKDRADLREAFFWEPRPHVKRIIFIATPHRGSEVADSLIGDLGDLVAKPSDEFRSFYRRISANNPGAFTPDYERLGEGTTNSIDGLSPDQLSLRILDELPSIPGVQTHSIIGRGKNSGPLEESSDGVVPYRSSHHPSAQSELIVPARHFPTIDHPDTLAEIKRVLGPPF